MLWFCYTYKLLTLRGPRKIVDPYYPTTRLCDYSTKKGQLYPQQSRDLDNPIIRNYNSYNRRGSVDDQ